REVNRLKEYSINFGNLKIGKHLYDFEVDDSFFEEFEFSLVKHGKADVRLMIDKQKETFLIFTFDIKGGLNLDCDRCLDEFEMPFESQNRLIVKLEGKKQESN